MEHWVPDFSVVWQLDSETGTHLSFWYGCLFIDEEESDFDVVEFF